MAVKLAPSRYGAAGSINAYTLKGGFAPAATHFILSDSDRLHYYIGAIEYKAPTSSGGQPRQYAGVGLRIWRLDSGTITNDVSSLTGNEFNDVVQGMVICDGPTPGTPVLLVTFGTGNPNPGATSQTGVYYRSLSTDTTPWTAATAADTSKLTAWQIIKAGPDLYAVCDAGRAAALGDYRISKCPAGNDPTLAASWSNGVEVGTPEWNITGLAAIGASPVVGRPDGLYYYDEQTRRYENVLKHFEIVPHALNGKVTASVTGGAVYTTYDGGAYFFDGVAAQEISPRKLWKLLGKDVSNARITAIADRGDSVIMVPETGCLTTQNAGLVINTVTAAGAATAITANCIDGNLNTGGSLSSLAATSHIDIWADIPFEGVIFHITRKPNSTTTALIGTVSYSSANDTFTAASGFIDGTRLTGNKTTATSGGSFSYVAFPPSASAGIVMAKDPDFGAKMTKVDFNYSSGTDISQKYGMRISMSGAALDADVEVDEVEIIPFRAGLPNGGILSASTNFTNRYRSGLIQPVYVLKRQRTTGFVPHEMYAVDSYGGTWAMASHAGRLGQASGGQNLGQSIILWGRYRTIAISETPTQDVSFDLYPITVEPGTTRPGPVWQWARDEDFGTDEQKQIEWVSIDTEFVQPTDSWEVFFQYDQHDIQRVSNGAGGPIYFTPPPVGFRRFSAWLVLDRAATTTERAPLFLEPVRVEVKLAGERQFSPRDRATQVPPAT